MLDDFTKIAGEFKHSLLTQMIAGCRLQPLQFENDPEPFGDYEISNARLKAYLDIINGPEPVYDPHHQVPLRTLPIGWPTDDSEESTLP